MLNDLLENIAQRKEVLIGKNSFTIFAPKPSQEDFASSPEHISSNHRLDVTKKFQAHSST